MSARTYWTVVSAAVLALIDRYPVEGLLAAAEVREHQANAAGGRRWFVDDDGYGEPTLWAGADPVDDPNVQPLLRVRHLNGAEPVLQHIAAEANPVHALAEAALWRRVADQWDRITDPDIDASDTTGPVGCWCVVRNAAVAAARAYLGGEAW